MLAKAIEVAILAVMQGHVYKFNNEIKQQKEGGAIGLELTGELAGVFMTWWDNCLKKKLKEEGVDVKVYKRYVDDINVVISERVETKAKMQKKKI